MKSPRKVLIFPKRNQQEEEHFQVASGTLESCPYLEHIDLSDNQVLSITTSIQWRKFINVIIPAKQLWPGGALQKTFTILLFHIVTLSHFHNNYSSWQTMACRPYPANFHNFTLSHCHTFALIILVDQPWPVDPLQHPSLFDRPCALQQPSD